MEKEAKTCLKGPIAYYIGLFFFYLGFATAGWFISYIYDFILLPERFLNHYELCILFASYYDIMFYSFKAYFWIFRKKIGFRLTILTSAIIIYAAALLNFFINTFTCSVICFCLFGIGTGFSALTSKEACLFFPKRRGLIVSIIRLALGLMHSLYYKAGEHLINPNRMKVDPFTLTYTKTISLRYKYYLLLIACALVFGTVIFLVITIRISFAELLRKNSKVDLREKQNLQESFLEKKENKGQVQIDSLKGKKSTQYLSNLKLIFRSWTLWNLFLISICIAFLPLLITNTSRPLSDRLQFSRKFMENLSIGNTVGAAVSCLIWGIIYDCLGSKLLLFFSSIGLCLNGGFLILSIMLKNAYCFGISLLINTVLRAGISIIFFGHVTKVFGFSYLMEISGFIGFSLGGISIFGAAFEFVVIEYLKIEGNYPFFICYGTSSVLCFIAFFLICCLNEEPFDYSKNTISEEINDLGKVLTKEEMK